MEALCKAGDRFQNCSDFYFRTTLRDIKNLIHINLTLKYFRDDLTLIFEDAQCFNSISEPSSEI